MAPLPELVELAKRIGQNKGIDPPLVCAVVEQESAWNPWAMRYEPTFMRHYVKPTLPEAPTTGEIARATSWGLMQLMGQVALELGFPGPYFSALCDPAIGLDWGCRKLAKCMEKRSGDTRAALLMWNGGGNFQYPDQVLARLINYR